MEEKKQLNTRKSDNKTNAKKLISKIKQSQSCAIVDDLLYKPQESYTKEDIIILGQDLKMWIRQPRNLWVRGWASENGLSKDHVEYLKKKFPIFKQAYEDALDTQERKLVEMPFFKEADANHARFILQNRFENWDKSDRRGIELGDLLNGLKGLIEGRGDQSSQASH